VGVVEMRDEEKNCKECGLPRPKDNIERYAENPYAEKCSSCGFYYIDLG